MVRSRSNVASVLLSSLIASTGCGSQSNSDLFSDPLPIRDSSPVTHQCSINGTWATFVELGVEWQSGVLRPGAGTVRQWTLSERQAGLNGDVLETSRACGVGAQGVPLGSPWFSTIEISGLLEQEWTGAQFLPQLFDLGHLPPIAVRARMIGADPENLQVDKGLLELDSAPYSFGLEGLPPDAPWPDNTEILPFMVDHDGDGYPGLAGMPFNGQVPGEAAGVHFREPRLELSLTDAERAKNPPRAGRLFLALRTRVSLTARVTSCDPVVRFEGRPDPEALRIETRNVGCLVAGTNTLCSKEQLDFIDTNLPIFEPNGTGVVVSVKVPPGTSCEQVRSMGLEDEVE